MVPSTLSVGATFWTPSGFTASIFLPRSGNVRSAALISTGLSAGPTAWDARLAVWMRMSTAAGPLVPTTHTRAEPSLLPHGFTPLNSGWARPFQNWRWLNTALTADGVLTPVTCRAFPNTGSATDVVTSAPDLLRPCEPVALSTSVGTAGSVNG